MKAINSRPMFFIPLVLLCAAVIWQLVQRKKARSTPPPVQAPSQASPLEGHIGKTGLVLSTLSPAGTIWIDGEAYHAISPRWPIRENEYARVIRVNRQQQLVVTPVIFPGYNSS